jgi:hypothetical protein
VTDDGLMLANDGAQLVDHGAEVEGLRFGPGRHQGDEHGPQHGSWHVQS